MSPRTARALAVAALLSAPAANAFMFSAGPAFGCAPNCVSPATQAAMKAISKFQPKVENTASDVSFKFETAAEQDIDVNVSKLGTSGAMGSMLNVNFKNAELPSWAGMQTSGAVSRSFFMPPGIAADELTTSFDNGVYTVKLPKRVRDEAARQQQPAAQQPAQQRAQQSTPSSSADYLRSLSQPQQQQQSTQQRPKATGEPKQSTQASASTTSSSNAAAQQPTTAGQYIDQMLSELFGVPAGTDPFAPPTAEQVAAMKERQEQAMAAARERRTAIKRASMSVSWDQSPQAYTISIDIPVGTTSSDVKLVSAQGRALEVRLSSGAVRRIQLPRDARVSAVSAKFDRDGEDKSAQLVRRCVVTVPKEQPNTINIEMN